MKKKPDETPSIKEIVIIIATFYFFIGLMCGLINSSNYDYYEQKVVGCEYKSIASLISSGYIIGCELGRPRFKIKKETE